MYNLNQLGTNPFEDSEFEEMAIQKAPNVDFFGAMMPEKGMGSLMSMAGGEGGEGGKDSALKSLAIKGVMAYLGVPPVA